MGARKWTFIEAPREHDRDPKWNDASLASATKVLGEVLDRLSVLIEKADAEIAHARPVYDRAANDVGALLECEPLGDDIIHHHAPGGEQMKGCCSLSPSP